MSDTVADTMVEITETDPMRRQINRDLMVAWINANLLNRAHHGVCTSIVLYDDAKTFITAVDPEQWEINAIRETAYSAGARYWSQGIV